MMELQDPNLWLLIIPGIVIAAVLVLTLFMSLAAKAARLHEESKKKAATVVLFSLLLFGLMGGNYCGKMCRIGELPPIQNQTPAEWILAVEVLSSFVLILLIKQTYRENWKKTIFTFLIFAVETLAFGAIVFYLINLLG
jgi:cytochrome bd-type quinol oxidase subunit 2